jgi:NADPH-dependent glutamate synthase beta subunit-like oxidoreductase
MNGRRVACVGGGPASLTVARDLAPLGYHVTVFDQDPKPGGMIRTQIPRFRLPEEVIDEETGYVLGLGVEFRGGARIESLKALLNDKFDAVFVGSGAPRGRDLDIPGRKEAAKKIHVGIDWLASVSFGHVTSVGRRVIVLGGGNTAMDCCRTARRLGGDDVKVIVRSGFDEMKASPWEKEDAMHEGIPILNYLVPKAFLHENGRLTGMRFEKVKAVYDAKGHRALISTGEPDPIFACDEVLVAVGQENAFPWIERDLGLEFDPWGLPVLDRVTLQSTLPKVFFGGDAALGPKNIIWAVAQGHDAAISIDKFLHGEDLRDRPAPGVSLISQKMGIHEWSYDNEVAPDTRFKVPWRDVNQALANIRVEVELGFDAGTAWKEAQRCLNCDVQTVFSAQQCIECDACVDICPTDCINFTANGDEAGLRPRLRAPALNTNQPLYVSGDLKTGRVMVKDEDVCLHCGLCAERCPTGAWDMQKFLIEMTHAGRGCRTVQREAA